MAATRPEFENKDCRDSKEIKSKVNMQRVSCVKGLHRTLENYLRKPKTADQAVEGQEEGQGCGVVDHDHDHSPAHSLALTPAQAYGKGASLKLDRSNKSNMSDLDVDVDVDSDVSDAPMLVDDQGSVWDVQDRVWAGEVDADVDEPDLEQPILLEGSSWADKESMVTQSEGMELGTEANTDTSESGKETWSMVVGRKEWQLMMARPGQKQGLSLDQCTSGVLVNQGSETCGPVIPHTNSERAPPGLSSSSFSCL